MRNLFTLDRLTSLVAAPLIWAAHFLFCYVLVSLACAYGFGGTGIGIALATVIALALIGYTALANYRKWRRAQQAKTPGTDIGIFFSLNSMLLCTVSAIALVWVAYPAAMLPVCAT